MTTPKKLSEIGRTTTTKQGFKDPDGTICITDSATTIHFSPAERRELVEAGVYRFIMDFIGSYELDRCESLGEAIKTMFEENGL